MPLCRLRRPQATMTIHQERERERERETSTTTRSTMTTRLDTSSGMVVVEHAALYLSPYTTVSAIQETTGRHLLHYTLWIQTKQQPPPPSSTNTTNSASTTSSKELLYYHWVGTTPLPMDTHERTTTTTTTFATEEDDDSRMMIDLPHILWGPNGRTPVILHVTSTKQVPFGISQAVCRQLEQQRMTMTTRNDNSHDNNNNNESVGGGIVWISPLQQQHCHSGKKQSRTMMNWQDYVKQTVSHPSTYWQVSSNRDLSNNRYQLQSALEFFIQTLSSSHDNDETRYDSIGPGSLDTIMPLDATASETIHQWPTNTSTTMENNNNNNNNNSNTTSLFGLVDCQTLCGRRLWSVWLAQPLTQMSLLQPRQDCVSYWFHHGLGRNAIRDALHAVGSSNDWTKLAFDLEQYATHNDTPDDTSLDDHDMHNEQDTPASSFKSFGSTRKALKALYQLYLVADQQLPMVVSALETTDIGSSSHHMPQTPLVDERPSSTEHQVPELLQRCYQELKQCQYDLSKSVELALAVLDMEKAPREFVIQTSYKPELSEIQDELHALDQELQDVHAEMNEQWAEATGSSDTTLVRLEQQQTTTQSNSSSTTATSWQFRLANTNDSKLLEQHFGSNITIHRLLKNGVYFSTKALRQISSKHADLMAEYERHQRSVVIECMQVAATYAGVLDRCVRSLSQLDCWTALAHLAAFRNYCCPVLTDSDGNEQQGRDYGIVLKQARHPCVELQDLDFIPNDVTLQFGKSSFLLVTGPNMGGKSTYIRALGAIVTLAQVGSYVPCSSATINLCHQILARVGAGDLQAKGISTFMAEMLESSSILRRATKRSLIIIDELGRGTSTFDGYGLARAISEYIVQKIGCMTVFTTHFHELTALEEQEAAVQNCHVTAQKGTHGLTFLYEVKPGPCLESFGIQVAEMANVPAVVVEDARRKARDLENFDYGKEKLPSEDGDVIMDDGNDVVDHAAAENAAEAVAFMNRFRRVDLPSIANDPTLSGEEKKARLLAALGS